MFFLGLIVGLVVGVLGMGALVLWGLGALDDMDRDGCE